MIDAKTRLINCIRIVIVRKKIITVGLYSNSILEDINFILVVPFVKKFISAINSNPKFEIS